MAIWEIPNEQKIDYSPTGDDIDSFSQKVDYCLKEIFKTLQHIRANGATSTISDGDTNALPYEIRVDTSHERIYMRNSSNTAWILLGDVADYLGITPEKIQAIRNGGGINNISIGYDGAKPDVGNSTNDLYFSTDTTRLWRWNGTKWDLLLSRRFEDSVLYEAYCINRNELTQQGGISYRGKVLQLDNTTGKANIDITGSSERLGSGRYKIDLQNPQVGQALVFDPNKDGGQGAFVNRPMMFATDIENIQDGQILVYNASTHSFHNSDNNAVGEGRTLTLRNGNTILGSYNGSATLDVDLQGISNTNDLDTSAEGKISHLVRLVENLYCALDVSKLNPSGYDGFVCETFRDDATLIDKTNVAVTSVHQSSNTLIVEKTDGLSEGLNYRLTDGTRLELVKISTIDTLNNTVILENTVTKAFTVSKTKLVRTNRTITEQGVRDNAVFTTILIPIKFEPINKPIGQRGFNKATVLVHHDNVQDTSISAEIALQSAHLVKGAFVGVGIGQLGQSTFELKGWSHGIALYGLKVYFNGVEQSSGYYLDRSDGRLYFSNAPNGVIITADYYIDGGPDNEEFILMNNDGTFVNQHDNSKAITQFSFDATKLEGYEQPDPTMIVDSAVYLGFDSNTPADSVSLVTFASLRFTTKLLTGSATEEIPAIATSYYGAGIKLKHKAVNQSAITVTPSSVNWVYDDSRNVVYIINQPQDQAITINYNWGCKSFTVDSFTCLFDE